MSKIKEEVAKILLDTKAVTLRPKNPFRYTSGILSPIYTDCRLIISYPKQRKTIKDLYIKTINDARISFDIVAGTSTAGIPWTALISDSLDLPMIYVRNSAKAHGKQNQIEGIIKRGNTAIVIEDLISTGKSSIETIKAIRNSGAKAHYIFSIATYQIKTANDNFVQNDIKLISLTDFDTIVRVAQKHNYINKKDYESVITWTENPITWGKRMGFEV